MSAEPILVRFYDRVLEAEAAAAVTRARDARSSGSNREHAASSFVAIVTAATSAEFYLSEILAHLQEVRLIRKDEREKVLGKEHVWQKFNALTKLFDRAIDRESYYRPYRALVVLRNCLVHRSAEFRLPGEWPEDLEEYRDVIPHVAGSSLDWTSQILDADTAAWAAAAAKTLLDSVHRIVPDPAHLSAPL